MMVDNFADKNQFVRDYRAESGYFNGPDGVAIGTILNREIRGGRVCDLGCGPTLPLYAVSYFQPNILDICGLDSLPECIDYIKVQIESQLQDEIVNEAIVARSTFDSTSDKLLDISTVYAAITDLRVGSVLEQQLSWKSNFDSVIQIGCFGALQNQSEFNLAVHNAHFYLKMGGKFISATWVHDGTVKRPHNFDSNFSGNFKKTNLLEGIDTSGFTSYQILELPVLDSISAMRGYQKILIAIAIK